MRPATLAEAIERIVAGEPRDKALPEFLDTFYLASTPDVGKGLLADTPPLTATRGSMRSRARWQTILRGNTGCRSPGLGFEPERFLDRPWHVARST